MYVLFLSDINYPKKSVHKGEIYPVRITPYSGGYALFAVTPEMPDGFGYLQTDHYMFNLNTATYVTASHEELLKEFWNANKEHYIKVDVQRKEQREKQSTFSKSEEFDLF